MTSRDKASSATFKTRDWKGLVLHGGDAEPAFCARLTGGKFGWVSGAALCTRKNAVSATRASPSSAAPALSSETVTPGCIRDVTTAETKAVAGSLLAVPRSILEAAAVDGAGPVRRFFSIALPMLTPTLFFLVVVNFVYGFFETFAVVDATTRGGPAGATTILVYKVYLDGFVSLDIGSSAAQSIILMALALALTFVQFRFIEQRINYSV